MSLNTIAINKQVLTSLLNEFFDAALIFEKIDNDFFRVLTCNNKLLQMFELDCLDGKAIKIEDLLCHKNNMSDFDNLMNSIVENRSFSYQTLLYTTQQKLFYAEVSCKPIIEDNSLCNIGIIQIVDITAKEKVGNSSAISYQNDTDILIQYKLAIDESAIVSKTDPSGNITYVNSSFCKISGYEECELIGKNHSVVRHPNMPKEIFQNLWSTILSKKTWKGIIENRKKDGSSYIVDATIKPILNMKDGSILEFISIRYDITSEVKAKLDAEKALSQKSDFFANVSHELRTPLNVVINFSEDILEDFDKISTNEQVREESRYALAKIIRSAKYLLSIINDLLDISKLNNTNNQIILKEESLNIILNDVYENLKNSVKHGVIMETELTSEILTVKTNARYMKQIIINLLSNAIKFTNHGKIKIILKSVNGCANIIISDTGRGIAKEKMDMIFEPFVQVNSFDEGTGLGLKLVKDMCSKLGISMQVESEVDKGTSFLLKLNLIQNYKI